MTTITVKQSNINKLLGTGLTSYKKSNNIYDLSGNCCEYTQEAHNDIHRVLRGGHYYNNSSIATVSSVRTVIYPTYSSTSVSSRPQLYIK